MTSDRSKNGHTSASEYDAQPELFPLSHVAKRRIEKAVEIAADLPDQPDYLHSVLCQLGFPRSRTDTRVFERSSGNALLSIEAGRIYKRGKFLDVPMPYSTHPRLVLIHLCSRAVLTKDPVVEVGNSIHEFLNRIGISTGGGKRGGYTVFRRQMEALAACTVRIGYTDEADHDVTISTQPVARFEAWLHHDDEQTSMWPGVMELSIDFFQSLQEHSVPLDPRAVAALKDSSLALDAYSWLAHRLRRIRKSEGVFLSWRNLYNQFGAERSGEYAVKNFKREFLRVLKLVKSQYQDAKFEQVRGGIRFYSSPSPIPQSKVVVMLPEKTGD